MESAAVQASENRSLSQLAEAELLLTYLDSVVIAQPKIGLAEDYKPAFAVF